VARPRTSKPRSPEHGALGRAIEVVIAEDANMTQESVAHDAGMNPKQVGELARGQANPTYTNLLRVCKGLRISPSELLAKAEELERRRRKRD
jgi:transcriptional regulator with XRE-family HTH domain